MTEADDIAAMSLSLTLETERFGRIVEVHDSLTSTNDRATQIARADGVDGLAVVAYTQTKGRGQRGNTWHSPARAGLYASFLTRPQLSPRMAPTITILTGVAVCEAIKSYGAQVGIKWPNDILVNEGDRFGHKIAGILVESSADASRIHYAVIGIGINLTDEACPKNISATSLEALTGKKVEHGELLSKVAQELEKRILLAESGGMAQITSDWIERAICRDQEVTVFVDGREVTGVLSAVAEDGALQLETSDGIEDFYRGELRICAGK